MDSDILLYNNADGEPHISIMSDAIVYHDGLVVWKPPSIYKSFCPIDIDLTAHGINQEWKRDKYVLAIRELQGSHTADVINTAIREILEEWEIKQEVCHVIVRDGAANMKKAFEEDAIETLYDSEGKEYQYLKQGMDLSSFYPNLEWDLMGLTSKRHEQLYPGCCGQAFYIDITFEVALRRKPLFYTVNLVIPCMLIAILTIFVFYIPACEHKITYSISILVTLTVFYLVLIELIPPTSLVIPLIGKYLLFTMFLVSFSIAISVVTLNFHRRDGTLHTMPNWIYQIFIRMLPKVLLMEPPDDDAASENEDSTISETQPSGGNSRRPSPFFMSVGGHMVDSEMRLSQLAQLRGMHPDVIRRMVDNICFIADHFRAQQKHDKISENWSYVAMVLDRLLLIIFSSVLVVGTILILTQSPSLTDTRQPMKVMPPTKPLSGDTFGVNYGLNKNINENISNWA
uniref:Uncharacterized protein n=1 Tax=Ditylenchus dipsaci TaxID=166011 RepID=A0A915DND2_9BILA